MSESPEESRKSVVLTGYGGYDQIQVQETKVPLSIGPDEVKVKNTFCGVNFADVYTLKGLLQQPTPFIMGLECVGKVIDVGANVHGINVGDRVVCYRWTGGLYREIVVLNATNCFVIPPEISDKDAVALPANYLTAFLTLFKMAKVEPGQSILIHSCAGGVGWAATQLAKTVSDVTVLGTASESKLEAVKENGVKYPMTYENYSVKIKEVVPDGKVDYVIDCMGGSNFTISQTLLKPLGQVILTGCSSFVKGPGKFTESDMEELRNSAVTNMGDLVVGNKAVSGFHLGLLMDQYPDVIASAMKTLFQLLLDGKIKPRIDSVWPFEQVVEANSLLADRKNIGKVLLSF